MSCADSLKCDNHEFEKHNLILADEISYFGQIRFY